MGTQNGGVMHMLRHTNGASEHVRGEPVCSCDITSMDMTTVYGQLMYPRCCHRHRTGNCLLAIE